MQYFAYGSNMSTRRLVTRVPAARAISVAALPHHRLVFHKVGKDGSAKCDAQLMWGARHEVVGVVFEIDAREKTLLDIKEGLGNGYAQKTVNVITPDARCLTAFMYYATITDASLKAFHWYKEHVLRGAREHGLARAYIRAIERIESVPDPRSERHDRELSVYRQTPTNEAGA